MQFQVPQFIEVEDKIFGPLTFKQFLYLAGGAGACYLIWRMLPLLLAAPLVLGLAGTSVALAFFEWNGRPFIVAAENAFFFFAHPKLYLWNNEKKDVKKIINEQKKAAEVYIPRLSESRLHELAWSLDIKERVEQGFADEDDRAAVRRAAPIRTSREARIQ